MPRAQQQRNDIIVNDLIEESTVQNPVYTTIRLKFDGPRTKQKTGDNGPYNLHTYGCTVDGSDAVLFAYDPLHHQIQEAGAGKGDFVSVAKLMVGNRTNWSAFLSDAQGRPIDSPAQPQQQPQQQRQQSQDIDWSNPLDQEVVEVPGFRDHVAEYAACVNAAALILSKFSGEQPEQSALQAMAFSIYRSAMDRGVEITPDYRHESLNPEPDEEPPF